MGYFDKAPTIINYANPGHFTPEMFGAKVKYDASVDEISFVQQAIDNAVSAGGGEVFLSRNYQIPNGGLTVLDAIKIRGIGGRLLDNNQGGTFPGNALSGFRCPSSTADCLTINTPGIVLEDFAIINTSPTSPTAGTGLKLVASHNHALNRVTVQGFYNDIQVDGRFGTIDSCHFYDPVNYGMFIFDSLEATDNGDFGDQGVSNCVIAMLGAHYTAVSALRWESGGGLRWVNNKIVAGTGPGAANIGNFQYGVDIMVDDNCNSGEIEITGGAISTCTVTPLRIGQKGPNYTGFIHDITINGTIFQGAGTSAVAAIIGGKDSTYSAHVKELYINGLTLKGVPSGGFQINGCQSVVIGTNIWDNLASYTGPLITINGATATDSPGIYIARQNIGTLKNVDMIVDNRPISSNGVSQAGNVDHGFTTGFYANTVGTWVTLGYFDIGPSNQGGTMVLDVEFNGYDYNVGPIYVRQRRLVTCQNTAGPVTIATLGSDETGGTGSHYAIQYDTATNNRVKIQYQLTAGGTTVWGRAMVNPVGQITRSHIGS